MPTTQTKLPRKIYCKFCQLEIVVETEKYSDTWLQHIMEYHWNLVREDRELHEIFFKVFEFFFYALEDPEEMN